MATQSQQLMVVVDADGTVRFDDDVADEHRNAIIAQLTDRGHVHERVAGTRHVKIINWVQGKAV